MCFDPLSPGYSVTCIYTGNGLVRGVAALPSHHPSSTPTEPISVRIQVNVGGSSKHLCLHSILCSMPAPMAKFSAISMLLNQKKGIKGLLLLIIKSLVVPAPQISEVVSSLKSSNHCLFCGPLPIPSAETTGTVPCPKRYLGTPPFLPNQPTLDSSIRWRPCNFAVPVLVALASSDRGLP